MLCCFEKEEVENNNINNTGCLRINVTQEHDRHLFSVYKLYTNHIFLKTREVSKSTDTNFMSITLLAKMLLSFIKFIKLEHI